jgi:hypothetical protein
MGVWCPWWIPRVFDDFTLFLPCILTVFFIQFVWLYVGKSLAVLFIWHTKKCPEFRLQHPSYRSHIWSVVQELLLTPTM